MPLGLLAVLVLMWPSGQEVATAGSCAPLTRQLKNAPLEAERKQAAETLGSLRDDAGCAVPPLLDAIEHDDSYIVPYTALHALQKLGPNVGPLATAVVDRLILLKRESNDFAVDPVLVAETLAKLGPAAIPRLVFHLRTSAPSLDDDKYQTAGTAGIALGRLGADAVPALVKVLPDPQRSNDAVNALSLMGPAAADAVPALLGLYRDGTLEPAMAGPHNFAILRAFYAMGDKACRAKQLLADIARSGESDASQRMAEATLKNLEHCPR